MIVVISNIVSAKMVPFPYFEYYLIPAGLFIYPLSFLMSDLVTEFFGAQMARKMVYITLGMNLLVFAILQIALHMPAQSLEEQYAFQSILGLSGLRIFSSLAAYSIAQLVDIQIYSIIKHWTGSKHLWIRANGSTGISQCVDTILVDIIFLYWGLGMGMGQVFPIMLFSFAYKLLFSITITPVFYLLIFIIRRNLWRQNVA